MEKIRQMYRGIPGVCWTLEAMEKIADICKLSTKRVITHLKIILFRAKVKTMAVVKVVQGNIFLWTIGGQHIEVMSDLRRWNLVPSPQKIPIKKHIGY